MRSPITVYARVSVMGKRNKKVIQGEMEIKTFKNIFKFLKWKSSYRMYIETYNDTFDRDTLTVSFTYWIKDLASGKIIETISEMKKNLTTIKEYIIYQNEETNLRNYTWRGDLGGWMKNKEEQLELNYGEI